MKGKKADKGEREGSFSDKTMGNFLWESKTT